MSGPDDQISPTEIHLRFKWVPIRGKRYLGQQGSLQWGLQAPCILPKASAAPRYMTKPLGYGSITVTVAPSLPSLQGRSSGKALLPVPLEGDNSPV